MDAAWEYSQQLRQALTRFEKILESNFGKNLAWFVNSSALAGFALSLTAIAATYYTNSPFFYITLSAAIAFIGAFPLHFMLQHFLWEQNKRKRDSLVPDLLLQASAFPRGISFNKIINYFSENRFGLLGLEFEKAEAEIEKGSSVQKALENIALRCESPAVSRAMRLLKQGFESGADMSETLRESAEDLLETNSILRERNAALVVEKYTLLIAGGLIVPVILGLLVAMVSSMDFSAFELLEFGLSGEERANLLSSTILANQIYIIEYALLASVFVAQLEGNTKKALVYASILLPLSLLSFNAAKFLLFG